MHGGSVSKPAKYGVMDEEPDNQRTCVTRRLAVVALKDAPKATQQEWAAKRRDIRRRALLNAHCEREREDERNAGA